MVPLYPLYRGVDCKVVRGVAAYIFAVIETAQPPVSLKADSPLKGGTRIINPLHGGSYV